MSISTGQQALFMRIVTMTTSASIVLPNGPGKGLPRYVLQAAGGAQRTFDLSGKTESDPEISVRVETKAGNYATDNNTLVAALVARFKPGAKFNGVEITEAPLPRPPLPVRDGVYSVPVTIRGRYVF